MPHPNNQAPSIPERERIYGEEAEKYITEISGLLDLPVSASAALSGIKRAGFSDETQVHIATGISIERSLRLLGQCTIGAPEIETISQVTPESDPIL